MQTMIRDRLIEKIEALEYRVESFGDLGAERELEELRKELQERESANRQAIRRILRVA